jgi:hypothetical protein
MLALALSTPALARAEPGSSAAPSPAARTSDDGRARWHEAEYPAAEETKECAKSGEKGCATTSTEASRPGPIRRHDGFFARAGAGLALIAGAPPTTSVELFVGGTPAPGLVIGAGYFIMGLERSENTRVNGYSGLVQYYPEPTGGLHFQGLVGALRSEGITAPFAAVGAGWEFWVGAETSIGGFARAGYLRTLEEQPIDAVFGTIGACYTYQ